MGKSRLVAGWVSLWYIGLVSALVDRSHVDLFQGF